MPAKNPPAKMLEEARKCYELQGAGFSTYQIAEKMGFSQKTVRNRIDLHITKRVHPDVDQMRTRQITRLEAYIRSLWEKAMSGDEKAINAAIRTEERIARLMGTDSATLFKVEATHATRESDALDVQKVMDHFFGTPDSPATIPGEVVRRSRASRPSAANTNTNKPVSVPDEFATDSTFQPHEVHAEAVTLAEDLEEFEPVKADSAAFKPRRGRRAPNPADRFLVDSDD